MKFKGELRDCVKLFKKGFILTIGTEQNLSSEEINALKSAKNGLKIDITAWREPRSLNANAYFHLLVHKIAEVLNIGNDECKVNMNLEYGTPAVDKDGNKVIIKLPSSVDIKQFYEYSKFIAEKEENGLKLSYYILYKQTHLLNTKEMARLIDGVVQEAEQLGIETETPEKIAEMKSLWSEYEKVNKSV